MAADTCHHAQVDSLFRVNHTDPWVKGDPYRTSRTISLQNTRTSGNPVHGRAPDDCARPGSEEEASPEGSVVVARLMGGVEYGRPLATGWTGTLGVNWQRAKCLDEHGNCITQVCSCPPGMRWPSALKSGGLLRQVLNDRLMFPLLLKTVEKIALAPPESVEFSSGWAGQILWDATYPGTEI